MEYPFEVFYTCVEGYFFWVAKCPSLKGCVGQGDTIDEALAELEENEKSWLETAAEVGIDIPPVPTTEEISFSGKFTVRSSTLVHKEASENAKKQGISLNQYVNDAIVYYNSRCNTVDVLKQELRLSIRSHFTLQSRNNTDYSTELITPITALTPKLVY